MGHGFNVETMTQLYNMEAFKASLRFQQKAMNDDPCPTSTSRAGMNHEYSGLRQIILYRVQRKRSIVRYLHFGKHPCTVCTYSSSA